MKRRAVNLRALLPFAVIANLGLASCGEDLPEQCGRAPEGDFFYSLDPRLPSGADSTADIERTIPDAVLDTILVAPNFVPPILTYRFRAPGFPRLDIRLVDLLLDQEPDPAKRGLPVTQGNTYTLGFELTQQIVPASMSLRILDPQGLLFFAVNDWRPTGTAGSQIHENGYGGLNADGELRVLYENAGCESRDVSPDCYAEYTNRRLDFLIGSAGPLGLWSGDTGVLGNWRIHVHKAAKIVVKTGCLPELIASNGVSFTIERVGVR